MKKPAILYIGKNSGTSRHRAAALRRLGFDVFPIDPDAYLSANRFAGVWAWRTGARFLEDFIRQRVLASIPPIQFDFVYVDSGELVGPGLIRELKNRFGTVVNYNVDDPYGQRDGQRWRLYLQAVPLYDLIVVVRECNVSEAFQKGARDVLFVDRSADEIAHAPRQVSEQDSQRWASEVTFVGTWMPERGPLMARLVELGVPLSIYGDRWQKAREWSVLRSSWRGPGLYADDDYAKAVQCAKVSLGLLSKGNRDLATQRSFEIPYLGGVLCAERTPEHSRLYKEDEEAAFWSSPEECAKKCGELLKDEERRRRLAIRGRVRCLQNGTTNQGVLAQIFQRLEKPITQIRNFASEESLESAARL
jgi:spore maturation protein CgeB